MSKDPSIYRTIAAGLAALTPPVHVIWKLGPSELSGADPASILGFNTPGLPTHIHLTPWVPQNALLQTGRVAAFLTHGGLNSVYEAAYHGVPLAGLPFFGDAADNIAKAVSRRMGLSLGKPADLTPGRVAGGLAALLADPAYRAAAADVSHRLRWRPGGPARSVAADAVQRATQDWWAVKAVEEEIEMMMGGPGWSAS